MDLNQITLLVDQAIVTARPGDNLLQTLLAAGQDLPYFCWHPALGAVGSCRQCAVTLFDGPDDRTGRIVMACMTPITPGMRLSIADPAAAQCRDRVIEFVLTNHPHDCPVCEVGGECHLQDMTALAGHAVRRYRFTKRTHLNQNLGPFIRHEMNRCIGCYRCVRFYRDYAGGDDFGVFGANRNIYFGRAAPGTLESDFAGNLVEICPTGVFVDKPFSTRSRRKWDMRSTPSICPHCAIGCNITIAEREGEFRRVTNRYNPTLNGYFLCDRGRFGTGFIESAARLRPAEPGDQTTARLTNFLDHDDIIGIGSPRASLEANFALRMLVGADNFYAGVSDQDAALTATAVSLMRDHAVPIATLADAEAADAILILGDDPSDVAPRLALALRRAARRPSPAILAERQIAPWNDAHARIAGTAPGNLFIATPIATRLDDAAAASIRLHPTALISWVAALAETLDAAPQTNPIAASLRHAAAPVIVVGGQTCGSALLIAAATLINALRRLGTPARLVILLDEANSLGLGLMNAKPLSAALERLSKPARTRIIVLENDLHRRADPASFAQTLATIDQLCVLDHVKTPTTAQADLALAVGSFAETDGTFINLEGRAQRAYKAIFGANDPPHAWHLLRDAGIAAGMLPQTGWRTHAALMAALATEFPALAGCAQASPPDNDAAMQRPATLPHRYSGRTAVDAQRDVREPQPPAHPDSPLGTTMEGPPIRTDSPLVPIVWAPGWNAAQSVNKFPSATHSGVMLFAGNAAPTHHLPPIASPIPAGDLLFLPLTRIFGSEELSAHAPAIAARMSPPTIALNRRDAARLDLITGDAATCIFGATTITRIVTIDDTIPDGLLAIVTGLPGEPALPLPGPGNITMQPKPC